MKYNPHNYQDYASKFILNQKAVAIFLECGMGKTVITLTAIAELLHNYFEIIRVLVIAPLRVGMVWEEEVKKWDHLKHLRIAKVLGTEKERIQALNSTADIYVIKNGKRIIFGDVAIRDISGIRISHATVSYIRTDV
jgi:superfamily II DNA or RNA helicase